MLKSILDILISCATFNASYLMVRIFQAPNSDPDHALRPDRMANPKYLQFLSCYAAFQSVIGVIHSIFILLSQEIRDAVCLPASSWNPYLFTWSPITATLLPICLLGGHLRLLAYRQLQHNFTFRLAKPSKLVKTGIYAYVQHPSYIGAAIFLFCYAGLIVRTDGALSCWMGETPLVLALNTVVYANAVFLIAAVVFTYPSRILQEEALLRQSFGQEWEVYHRNTARLIPWLF